MDKEFIFTQMEENMKEIGLMIWRTEKEETTSRAKKEKESWKDKPHQQKDKESWNFSGLFFYV